MKLDGKQAPPQLNIDLEKDTKTITCQTKRVDLKKGIEVDCGGQLFSQGFELRRVSPLVSPTGKASVVPVPTFYCLNCGAEVDMKAVE
tara:strand:+ start:220 stop:483 length:264 start_codon:yes stop_codon:yes gene_type:complete